MVRRTLAALAGAAVIAVPAVNAGADEALPKPCAGVLITDKAGDQEVGPILGGPPGGPTNTTAPDNMDIRRVFFNTRNGVTTANIEVTNLTKEVPDEIATGHFSWFVDFDAVEGVNFVRAETDGEEVTFHAAGVIEVPGVASTPGTEVDLKGRFLEGPNGIIEIELPPQLQKPGLTLENVFAIVSQRTDNERYFGYINDSAPDDGASSGKKHTIAECPADAPQAAPEPTAVATPAPSPQPQPQATPTPSATPQPSGGRQTSKSAKRKKCIAKAKKIKNKRKRAKAVKRCKKR